MTKIETIAKWLKEPGSKKILAPKTLISCVYDENGETVEAKIADLEEGKAGTTYTFTKQRYGKDMFVFAYALNRNGEMLKFKTLA